MFTFRTRWLSAVVAAACAGALALPDLAEAGRRRRGPPPFVHEAAGHLTFTSPQSNPLALQPAGQTCSSGLLLVAQTTSARVDAIATATNNVIGTVPVGLDPVSVAFRPDGCEAWVSNHVSDSVSVIDTDAGSSSFLQVVETVQDLDAQGATRFDEPVGIAFKGDGSEAYVALSSRNDIAVVDTGTYAVDPTRLHITAQDPRALVVRGNKLYVLPFESGNQTEVSACGQPGGLTLQCSIWAVNFNTFSSDLLVFATNPNMPGFSKNIVVDPDLPDRDLFVYDTTDLGLAPQVVSGVGTLLYGAAVDDADRLYVTQTDALNAVNGNDALSLAPSDVVPDGDIDLEDLQNRMFLNQITELDCSGACTVVDHHDLEPAVGSPVSLPLATPYGVAVSSGASPVVVATAAGSSRVFTWDPSSGSGPGKVLDHLDVGTIPRGVALDSAAQRAYVLNTLGNSVSVVDVDLSTGPMRGDLTLVTTVPVGADPTPNQVRLGRIAFNDAAASSSGTFSCASCHPDGNTDQLLWRIGGECSLTGCVAGEDEARSTMPVRGLRDSVPLHWDGTLGDPLGGPDGSTGLGGNVPPPAGCSVANQDACFRHLVDASLSGVMCDQSGGCANGPSGLPGLLTSAERDDMAAFLQEVAYPPARSRRMDDSVSNQAEGTVQVGAITVGAREGFEDFFFDQGVGSLGVNDPNTCADSDSGCHELPLGTSTNSETLNAFDAPTMRGMTDRFLQFSLGVTGTEEMLAFADPGLNIPSANISVSPVEAPIKWNGGAGGLEEVTTLAAAFLIFEPTYNVRPLDMFQMFEEASTGTSGALGRQVTLNTATTAGCTPCAIDDLLAELEGADDRGVVNLLGSGLHFGSAVTISYDPVSNPTNPYRVGAAQLNRTTLIGDAQGGSLLATLTAHLRASATETVPQPLIAPVAAQCGTGVGPSGDPDIPGGTTITIESSHVDANDAVFLNGQPTAATITVLGTPDVCDTQGGAGPDEPDEITPTQIQISGIPRTGNTDLLQIRNTEGLLSNELPLP